MKVRRGIVVFAIILVFGFTSCGIEEENTSGQTGNSEKKEELKEQDSTGSSTEQKTEDDETTGESGNMISLYYPDEETGELLSEEVSISEIDAQVIWAELQKAEVVGENEKVLGIEIDADSIVLDLSKEFGEHLRSLGTTGERGLIDSIVNTYAEAYGCAKIKLTEEGGSLYSGHKEYDTYLERK